MKTSENIDSLIALVLSGEASHEEISVVEQWKRESPDNLEYFESMKRIFTQSAELKSGDAFDTDAAWLRVKRSISVSPKTHVSRKKIIPFVNPVYFRIAAALLIFAGLSYTMYKILTPEKVVNVTFAVTDSITEKTLPDSSTIVLNRNSTLHFSLSGNKRLAELKGEAFFNLAKDPSRPFELQAGSLLIRDIGTAFNVHVPGNGDSVQVLVTEGEVVLISPSKKSISLVKGEQVVYYKMRDEFIKSLAADTNALSYTTKIFVFENATLSVIISKLSDVYGNKISLSGEIGNCHLTATFKDEAITNILEIIAETLKLELIQNGDQFILKGAGCE